MCGGCSSSGDSGCGMAMSFNNNWFLAPILFEKWAPTNAGEVVGSMVAILFITIIFRICTVAMQFLKRGVLKSFFVTFTAGIGYLVMLITMTYIGWYFATVIVGIFFGDLIANALVPKSTRVEEEDSACGC